MATMQSVHACTGLSIWGGGHGQDPQRLSDAEQRGQAPARAGSCPAASTGLQGLQVRHSCRGRPEALPRGRSPSPGSSHPWPPRAWMAVQTGRPCSTSAALRRQAGAASLCPGRLCPAAECHPMQGTPRPHPRASGSPHSTPAPSGAAWPAGRPSSTPAARWGSPCRPTCPAPPPPPACPSTSAREVCKMCSSTVGRWLCRCPSALDAAAWVMPVHSIRQRLAWSLGLLRVQLSSGARTHVLQPVLARPPPHPMLPEPAADASKQQTPGRPVRTWASSILNLTLRMGSSHRGPSLEPHWKPCASAHTAVSRASNRQGPARSALGVLCLVRRGH